MDGQLSKVASVAVGGAALFLAYEAYKWINQEPTGAVIDQINWNMAESHGGMLVGHVLRAQGVKYV